MTHGCHAILLVLAGLLVLVTYAVPVAISVVLASSLAASVLGASEPSSGCWSSTANTCLRQE